MDQLKNRVIVVSGGSSGIGLEIAKKCASEGAKVIIASNEKDNLKQSINSLNEISNEEHDMYFLDVSQFAQVQEFTKWCKTKYGNIHGLVNCAGIYGPIGRIDEINIEDFVKTISINFLGTVNTCHLFIPLFSASFCKKIVNICGGGAASPFPFYSAYATSKIAIARLTENLSIELQEMGFNINCIAPGFVITRMHQETLAAGPEGASLDFYNKTKSMIDNGGTSPEVAADLSVFLLSDHSDGITGKFISAPWDPWKDEAFQERLRTDKDLATLRRIDDKTFFKRT